jgi:hypothetical protein
MVPDRTNGGNEDLADYNSRVLYLAPFFIQRNCFFPP